MQVVRFLVCLWKADLPGVWGGERRQETWHPRQQEDEQNLGTT